jgi:hypothetical protein
LKNLENVLASLFEALSSGFRIGIGFFQGDKREAEIKKNLSGFQLEIYRDGKRLIEGLGRA